jgi:hypothetical protein
MNHARAKQEYSNAQFANAAAKDLRVEPDKQTR